VHFVTKIYHPNVDGEGRICLNLLKPQPQGAWKPSSDIESALQAVRVLLIAPNPQVFKYIKV